MGTNGKRWVFELTNTGDEVLEGHLVELRGMSQAEAERTIANWYTVRKGATARLIGYRLGVFSEKRFFPLVPIAELPEHVVQNERVVPTKAVA